MNTITKPGTRQETELLSSVQPHCLHCGKIIPKPGFGYFTRSTVTQRFNLSSQLCQSSHKVSSQQHFTSVGITIILTLS